MDAILIALNSEVEFDQSLNALWHFVRPGGCICFEDVPTYSNQSGAWKRTETGYSRIAHSTSWLAPETALIFAQHDSFLADTAAGLWQQFSGNISSLRRTHLPKRHTHVLVLRKRAIPRSSPVRVLSGSTAMRGDKTVPQLPMAHANKLSLEELALRYGTDKSHDDHKYTDLYALLFDRIRANVTNITEIGVMAGQSMQVWNDYFPHAQVWGVDNWVKSETRRHLAGMTYSASAPTQRLHLLSANSQSAHDVVKLGFARGSMDIIIDDGAHKPECNEKTLLAFWPYLRLGGLYVIEDVVTGGDARGQFVEALGTTWSQPGRSRLLHDTERLQPDTRAIFTQNNIFLADTTVGHRNFAALARSVPSKWFRNRVDHNTHLIVIQKCV